MKTNTDSPENPGQTSEGARGAGENLSDAEVIATWMEPKPDKGPFDFRPWRSVSPAGWWVGDARGDLHPKLVCNEWYPRPLNLDALWEVEERLISEDSGQDPAAFMRFYRFRLRLNEARGGAWHADAPTRINALATVLRPIVEATAIQSSTDKR